MSLPKTETPSLVSSCLLFGIFCFSIIKKMIAKASLAFLSLTDIANELFLQERASTKSSTAKKIE